GRKGAGTGSARSCRHLVWDVHQRPDLDRALAGGRDLRRPLERLVERLCLDQVVAAELLLRLGERPVGDDLLAVADADGDALRRRLELVATNVRTALLELRQKRAVLLVQRGLVLVGQGPVRLLVAVDQQQVLHEMPPSSRSMSRARRTGPPEIDN